MGERYLYNLLIFENESTPTIYENSHWLTEPPYTLKKLKWYNQSFLLYKWNTRTLLQLSTRAAEWLDDDLTLNAEDHCSNPSDRRNNSAKK